MIFNYHLESEIMCFILKIRGNSLEYCVIFLNTLINNVLENIALFEVIIQTRNIRFPEDLLRRWISVRFRYDF